MTTVLIVDDVRPLAEQVAYDLRRLGDFQTHVVESGPAALDLLGAEPVDCILLDLEMPRMDGFEVLRALREAGAEIPAMKALREQINRLASIPSSVLILGESGTGKEVVARELHRQSGPERPFVAVNAGALPSNLVESELFGHERGAFTGADRVHRGAFERADGGTLFLDEIGELPASAQASLLRVLETRQVVRVGGEKAISVNTRVVAATHRDLEQDTSQGRFRTDLLYRLNTHILRVPPLRERPSDIPELARTLLGRICRDFGLPSRTLSDGVLQALIAQDWRRNNVRELRNAVERLVIASEGSEIGVDALPPDWRLRSVDGSFADQKREAERAIILRALERNEWRISETAADLGLADHASLLKIMRRLEIGRD